MVSLALVMGEVSIIGRLHCLLRRDGSLMGRRGLPTAFGVEL